MRIGSSTIGLQSARMYGEQANGTISFSIVKQNPFLLKGGASKWEKDSQNEKGQTKADTQLTGSLFHFRSSYKEIHQISGIQNDRSVSNAISGIRAHTILYLIQLFQGARKSSFLSLSEESRQSLENDGSLNVQPLESQSFYTILQGSASYEERETTSFSTKGTVVTEDGRRLDFGIEMEMSRSFREAYDEEIIRENVMFCDPLVINLKGNIANVSDQKFSFDIDNDGVLDEVSRLMPDSGYLALDLNEDGVINDGSELFGTRSGSGFADLAKYDKDGNGWIDENDEIWKKLLIWSQDEEGNDTLYHLSEKGIGAICLQNASTEFSLNNQETNETNARIRSTGIFLYENGTVGTVQHLDLAK